MYQVNVARNKTCNIGIIECFFIHNAVNSYKNINKSNTSWDKVQIISHQLVIKNKIKTKVNYNKHKPRIRCSLRENVTTAQVNRFLIINYYSELIKNQ